MRHVHLLGDPRQEAFDRLTELSSNLMASGEYEVYSETRRQFERAAALYEVPTEPVRASADGMDMFADSDDEDAAPVAAPKTAAPATDHEEKPAAAPAQLPAAVSAPISPAVSDQVPGSATSVTTQASMAPKPALEEDTTDYESWPIGELKRYLTENGVKSDDCIDKCDLAKRVRETAQRMQSAVDGCGMPGYTFDSASGYYYSASAGLYYDASTGGFYNGSTAKWYSYDSSEGQFKEWATAG